jgi:hypothetical protein
MSTLVELYQEAIAGDKCDHDKCFYLLKWIWLSQIIAGALGGILGCPGSKGNPFQIFPAMVNVYTIYYVFFVGGCAGQTLYQYWSADNGVGFDELGLWCGFLLASVLLGLFCCIAPCIIGCACLPCIALVATAGRVSPSLHTDRDVESIMGLEGEKEGRAALQTPLLQDKNP